MQQHNIFKIRLMLSYLIEKNLNIDIVFLGQITHFFHEIHAARDGEPWCHGRLYQWVLHKKIEEFNQLHHKY